MMLESIEKMRDYISTNQRMRGWKDSLSDIADEIEREISEKYMLLPVDADGVPIRVGDEMCCHKHGITSMEVLAVSDVHFWWLGETGVYPSIAESFHHVKPDPVKELLEEFSGIWKAAVEVRSGESLRKRGEQLVEEYAAKIREAVSESCPANTAIKP